MAEGLEQERDGPGGVFSTRDLLKGRAEKRGWRQAAGWFSPKIFGCIGYYQVRWLFSLFASLSLVVEQKQGRAADDGADIQQPGAQGESPIGAVCNCIMR